jgi:uncharacterized protein (UPF0276 family)
MLRQTVSWSREAGIGLRLPHVAEIAATRPRLEFLEVHAENYMAERRRLTSFWNCAAITR